jgi:RimJ/RimL family protein N-acetyltransferase
MSYVDIPDQFPTLRSGGLTLRELAEEDLATWFARRSDVAAAALAGDPVATSIADVIAGLQYHRDAFRAKLGVRWAIVPDEVGSSVGTIGFSEFLPGVRGAAVGAAIGRRHWGRGIATRAGAIVLDYGFEALRLEFVWAIVLPENARIIRVMEKLGFVRGNAPDGVNREIGKRLDTLYYYITRRMRAESFPGRDVSHDS